MNSQLQSSTKKVMRTITFRGSEVGLERNSAGEASIVVALPNEHLSDVLRRVKNVDVPVNLVVAYADYFEVLGLTSEGTPSEVLTVSGSISLGMLTVKLSHHPNVAVRVDIEDGSDRNVRISPKLEYA